MDAPMPIYVSWQEIALRLGLSLLASAVIGFNRERHGESAGLRTTMLVCMAAAISMVQVNLLMVTVGKTAASFGIMDLMRLPLGILTGVGFIGAGAIVKKGNIAVGVTTAATLWFVTVMGLCFGGGQLGLGLAAFAIGVLVLWALKWVERNRLVAKRGILCVRISRAGVTQAAIEREINAAGARAIACAIESTGGGAHRALEFVVGWNDLPESSRPPAFVGALGALDEIDSIRWVPDQAGRAAAMREGLNSG
ncbi:MAG TPA: MgtC/SapB family protein [Opitutaceae bacterium]